MAEVALLEADGKTSVDGILDKPSHTYGHPLPVSVTRISAEEKQECHG